MKIESIPVLRNRCDGTGMVIIRTTVDGWECCETVVIYGRMAECEAFYHGRMTLAEVKKEWEQSPSPHNWGMVPGGSIPHITKQ